MIIRFCWDCLCPYRLYSSSEVGIPILSRRFLLDGRGWRSWYDARSGPTGTQWPTFSATPRCGHFVWLLGGRQVPLHRVTSMTRRSGDPVTPPLVVCPSSTTVLFVDRCPAPTHSTGRPPPVTSPTPTRPLPTTFPTHGTFLDHDRLHGWDVLGLGVYVVHDVLGSPLILQRFVRALLALYFETGRTSQRDRGRWLFRVVPRRLFPLYNFPGLGKSVRSVTSLLDHDSSRVDQEFLSYFDVFFSRV